MLNEAASKTHSDDIRILPDDLATGGVVNHFPAHAAVADAPDAGFPAPTDLQGQSQLVLVCYHLASALGRRGCKVIIIMIIIFIEEKLKIYTRIIIFN